MTEHYVTFFDHLFLLQGLALYESLQRHQPESFLWVLCLDREAETQLARLQLPRLSIMPLHSFETPELLAAKSNRSWVEYIFTLTPFTYGSVFYQDSSIQRVTYVDADLFFFKNPTELLREMERANKQVMVTEHAFSPEYSSLLADFGRFCVQFLTVTRAGADGPVIRRWQKQCLESCAMPARKKSAVFGDQKYLDDWPEAYPNEVHICTRQAETLAPWNVDYYQALSDRKIWPVFYHFHSFRIFHPRWVQLCTGYNPQCAAHLYEAYLVSLRRQEERLKSEGIGRPFIPFSNDRMWLPRLLWRLATGRINIQRLPSEARTMSHHTVPQSANEVTL